MLPMFVLGDSCQKHQRFAWPAWKCLPPLKVPLMTLHQQQNGRWQEAKKDTFVSICHRHLSNIDCLIAHITCLVCFIRSVNGHSKKKKKKGWKSGASSGYITNLSNLFFFWYLWFSYFCQLLLLPLAPTLLSSWHLLWVTFRMWEND